MKKLRLLMAFCALFLIGGGNFVSAGTDVTASYIGDLSKIVVGSHNHGNNTVEHRLNQAAYPQGSAWWNDQSLPQGWHAFTAPGAGETIGESWTPGVGSAGVMMGHTMNLPEGNYTLSFKAFGTTADNASNKTASSAGDVVAFCTGQDNVDITNTTVGGSTFHNVSFTFTVTEANSTYSFGIKKVADGGYAEWCQMKDVSLVLNSTNITPIANDVTTGWTQTFDDEGSKVGDFAANTASIEGNGDGTNFLAPFLQVWKSSGNILSNQTISNTFTPTQTGVYKMSAWVRAVNESGGAVSGIKIFIGDTEADACTGSAITKGRLGTYTAMADGVSGTPISYGFRIQDATMNWISWKDVTFTYLGSLPDEEVNAIISTANGLMEQDMDADIKTALTNAKNSLAETKTVANYNTLASAIADAQISIAEYVAFAPERAKAIALGMDAATVATYAPNVQNLMVAEYEFVATNYSYPVSLGTWEKTGETAENKSQHWDGTSESTYLEQLNNSNPAAGWYASSWDIGYKQDIALPAGQYVFKVAGRKSSNDVTLTLKVKNGENVLGSVNDFPNGDTGLGINTSGATDYTTGEGHTYANNNNGRGWQWRYVQFTLAEAATVNIAITAEATAIYQWMGFCNPTVQTNNAATQKLIAYNIALSDAKKAIADDTYENVIGSEKTALQNAIAADASLDKSDVEAIEAATTTLNSACNAFTGAKTSYDNFVAAKAVNYEENLPYASATKFAAIATAQAAADAISAADAATKANAIYSAYRLYVESNALAEGVGGKDKTNLITDANMETAYDGTNHTFGAWQVISQTNGTIQRLSNQSFTDGSGKNDYNYADIYKNDNNAGIQQTIESLEPGQYILTVTARAKATDGATFRLFAGNKNVDIPRIGSTGGAFDSGWNDVSLVFTVTETSNVNIGVQSGNGRDIWWSATRFRLAKIGDVVKLNGEGYATYSANYAVEVSGAEAYTAELDFATPKITCTKIATNKVPAGNGVLLYGDANADVTLSITTDAAALGANNLKATTQADGTLATKGGNSYYALSGNTFKLFESDAFVHNKAYFEVEGGAVLARSMSIVFDGNITGVANVEAAAEAKAKDGKFIENGKLVIVKNGVKYNAAGAKLY